MSAPQRYHLLRGPRFDGERRSALETTRIPDRRGNLQCLPSPTAKRGQNVLPPSIKKCSTIGPRASAGK